MKALDAYQAQQEKKQSEDAVNAIKNNIAALTADNLPSAGAALKDADVTVIEFFDYNCGYCKHAFPDIQELIKEDKKLRFVFKEMPILGESSQLASQWALAAAKQGRYFDYHGGLMKFTGPKDEASLTKIATDLGFDIAKMKADVASDEIKKQIDASRELADKIGIRGTPAFIVGTELYPGYLGKDGLKDAIAKVRGAQKTKDAPAQ